MIRCQVSLCQIICSCYTICVRKTIFSLVLVVLLLLGNSGISFAADGDPVTDTSNIYNYNITQNEFDEYYAAVQNCDTPSLECLVRYTTRFIAMEWVNDIQGTGMVKGLKTTSDAGSPGLVSGIFSLIGGMYAYKPANTGRYVADVMSSAGFATPAYAQGLGFASLDPILGLWKMFRNVAYFFFIIIFIVIGFMIMFRARVGTQAVITAQQAIPSIIVSLILVTFSYAIAGFMIDLMYLLMFLIVGLFNGLGGGASLGADGSSGIASGAILNFDWLHLTGFLFKNSVGLTGENIGITQEFLAAAGLGETLGNIFGWLGGLTLTVVITIAVLIGAVRLFLELLKSYATIVLSVVLSPVMLMMGAIPGKNVFGAWLKGIIGNLLVFPLVLLLVIMFVEFTAGGDSVTTTGGFMPPFLVGQGQVGLIGPLMGFAIILAMPEIVKKVKDATGASDGGFGMMVATAALGRAKEAWNGKMPFGLNARNVVQAPVNAALMTAGGIGGYNYAANKAKQLGLEGRAATMAKLGGLAGGAALGPRAIEMAPKALRTLAVQYAQSQGKQFFGDIEEAAKKKKSTGDSESSRASAEKQQAQQQQALANNAGAAFANRTAQSKAGADATSPHMSNLE